MPNSASNAASETASKLTHHRFSTDALAEGILAHREQMQSGAFGSASRVHLAKAISLVESSRADDAERAQILIEKLLPFTGKAFRIGITGVPGVGKSTFIEAFALMLIQRGHRVAVLAVDPSSARTGGSILGDKTRMTELSRAPQAFIRPSPARTSLGGVARCTREALLLCEAAGFDVVLVETVGVGQSETAVASMVDFFLMLLLPNSGDELQGIKRGIMELADAFVINKADTDKTAAERAAQQIRTATHLFMPKYPDWAAQTLLTSATERTGIQQVWELCVSFFGADSKVSSDRFPSARVVRIEELRRRQAVQWMNDALHEGLKLMLTENADVVRLQEVLAQAVLRQEKSPTSAAHEILQRFRATLS